MTVETAPAPRSYDEWRDRHWRVTGAVFALAWLVAAAGVLGGGVPMDEFLRSLDPDLEVVDIASDGGFTSEWRGWRLSNGTALLAVGAWLGTLLLMMGGPEPWRATRWGWWWLLLAGGPLASLVFLLAGGPLGVGRPRDPARRLTGGWAFLIAILFLGGFGARG